MRTAAELEAGTLVGGYRIEGLVGRGGMGVVYRATQLALERIVALKLIAPELSADEQFRERFQREWRIAASLDHPNVLPIYEAGEAEGLLFLAMRYVDGQDLGTLVEREGGLAPTRAAAIVCQVASALDTAHAQGLVHRDVKPTNILLDRREGSEHAYLADFGLARMSAAGSGLSRTGELVGTVDFVAPEQVRGERVDAQSDVYALGCVLYQALTGRVPYPRENDLARLWAHMHEQPPAVTEALPDAPAELDEVVARALAKRPEDRYASAGDLGRAALAAAEGRAVGQSEQSVARGEAAGGTAARLGGRLARLRSRRRLLLVVSGALLVLAAAAAFAVQLYPEASADTEEPGPTASPSKPSQPTNPGEVVGEPIPIGSDVESIVVGEGGVWTLDPFKGEARQLDPTLNDVIGLPVPVPGEPFERKGLLVGESAVWLIARNTVSRIDPRTHAVDEPIAQLPGEDWVAVVAVGEGGVWIAASPSWYARHCEEDPELGNCPDGPPSKPRLVVTRVDLESGRATEVSSIAIPHRARFATAPVDLEIGEGAVWALVGDGTLLRIDPRTSVIGEAIQLGLGDREEPRALAVGDGSLWVLTYQNRVVRVDASSGQIVGSPFPVPAGNEWYGSAGFAFGEGSIWVTDISRNTVARIDPESKKVVGAPIEVPPRPVDVAVGDGAVWVASQLDGVVTRIDPTP